MELIAENGTRLLINGNTIYKHGKLKGFLLEELWDRL
jgi:hypothetical protein